MATTYITKARRQELIDEYMECYEETGGEDIAAEEASLKAMSNSELVAEIKASGWEIL